MSSDLSGRTALVTGSTRGLGLAIARALAAAGARVAVNGRVAETVAARVAELDGALAEVGDRFIDDGLSQWEYLLLTARKR
jgi:NAD(P)-dependent dehydrogenase (short-subunit alcohol dehydrogenase family)